VWDSSTVIHPTDIIMNQITQVANKTPITFGHAKIQIYIGIYNTQISYPIAIILLGMGDIKACFCFGRIYAD
jgi:hypothetical protein